MDKFNIEDYFWEYNEIKHENKHLILVIYDITLTKRRNRFVKFMESYGVRVQKSAFEMILDHSQYDMMVKKIPLYITDEDNVRVYKLKLSGEVVSWGSGMTKAEEVIII
ncbi:MAG: CRISPR-associated endonuclease Cas2 [Oscillospiraceae bacterium]|nr:CRISPR-associated endonuclease Cas2 [Oscillospiraceae bacterium]